MRPCVEAGSHSQHTTASSDPVEFATPRRPAEPSALPSRFGEAEYLREIANLLDGVRGDLDAMAQRYPPEVRTEWVTVERRNLVRMVDRIYGATILLDAFAADPAKAVLMSRAFGDVRSTGSD